MSTIASGWLTALFLYDVAEAIDLSTVNALIGPTTASRVGPRPPAPAYIQYAHPPVTIEGQALELARVGDWHVRFKVFDYGVASVAFTRTIPHTWDALVTEALRWDVDPELPLEAEGCCRRLIDRLRPALLRPRTDLLSEDYLVFAITQLTDSTTADALLASHGDTIAQLLRGERDPLSAQERDDVLRQRLSYLATDLVVPTWNAAFVYDTDAGASSVLEIVEFANSQLLEFRYYDALLDGELAQIYDQLQQPGSLQSWFGRRFTRAARQVHSLFIDVNELTDKTENALKLAGDVYAARLFSLVASRLGLEQWKGNVREKLKTLDDIYRFTVEQTSMARGELLELMIVLILILELVLFFAGIMQ
ncbi:MAG TPA: hypothetical protein VIK60_16815 [Vicinamibacterales bacterium]